jgi:hypothetical protein
MIIEQAAKPCRAIDQKHSVPGNHGKTERSATFGSIRKRTQRPAFQFEMLRRIVLDPKILGKLCRVGRGQRVSRERPEAFVFIYFRPFRKIEIVSVCWRDWKPVPLPV